jgi:hypothetical protein
VFDKKILVIDDCVSKQTQDFIEGQLHPSSINWKYISDVTGRESDYEAFNPGLSQGVFADNQILTSAYLFLYPLLLEVCTKQNIYVDRLMRIRLGLYINRNTSTVNNAHIDDVNPHMVALYYPYETDGDTVFFTDSTATQELQRISPKKGRMVIFDGSIHHASSNPIKHVDRITVNYNFIGVFK